MKGDFDIKLIANVIKSADPDVVALQDSSNLLKFEKGKQSKKQ